MGLPRPSHVCCSHAGSFVAGQRLGADAVRRSEVPAPLSSPPLQKPELERLCRAQQGRTGSELGLPCGPQALQGVIPGADQYTLSKHHQL